MTLWREISALAANPLITSRPWILLSNFNQILNQLEHFSIPQTTAPSSGIDEMKSCLNSNDLRDLVARGTYFTWTNRWPENPTMRKLDRAVTNDTWDSIFPNSIAIFDHPGSLDCSPCLIQLDVRVTIVNKPFKFFIHITSHPDYDRLLADAWDMPLLYGISQFFLSKKLSAAKSCAKLLNKQGFINIQARTKDALEKMHNIQTHLLSKPSQ